MTDYLGEPRPVDEISQDSGISLRERAGVPGPATPGAKLTALTTALALVLTGGVVTAAWRSFQSANRPEKLVPSSAFAVATLDLSLHGHDDALSTFADHFPDSPTRHGDGSAVDRLLRAVFRGSSDPHVDYDHDIKPWLGNHVAIAGWMDKAGKPQMEGLIESTDDAAAHKELTKLFKDGSGAFSFADGYAVLGDNPAAVQGSISAAHRASLADTSAYAADVDALPGDPALTGWLDGPAARKALAAALGPQGARMLEHLGQGGAFGMLGPMGLVGSAGMVGVGGAGVGSVGAGALAGPSSMFAGRTSLGVQVTDRYLEIDTRTTGTSSPQQTATAGLRSLPASTIAAVDVGDPSSLIDGVTSLVKTFSGFDGAESSCSAGFGGAVPPASAVPLNIPHRRQILRDLARQRRQLRRFKQTTPSCQMHAVRPPKPLQQIEKATGLQLPGDATTLVGDSLLASYGGLSFQGVPKIALRTHPADLSAAQNVLEKLQTHVGSSSPVPFTGDASGDDLVIATSIDYAHEVEQTGSFGEQPQVALALGDLPAKAAMAGYVDLGKILPLLGSLPRDVLALKAIGFWTATEDGVQRSQLRVLVG